MLVALVRLQVREGVWLHLRWVPSQDNADADSMTRLGVDEFIRLRPEVFRRVWYCFGPFQYTIGWPPPRPHNGCLRSDRGLDIPFPFSLDSRVQERWVSIFKRRT